MAYLYTNGECLAECPPNDFFVEIIAERKLCFPIPEVIEAEASLPFDITIKIMLGITFFGTVAFRHSTQFFEFLSFLQKFLVLQLLDIKYPVNLLNPRETMTNFSHIFFT